MVHTIVRNGQSPQIFLKKTVLKLCAAHRPPQLNVWSKCACIVRQPLLRQLFRNRKDSPYIHCLMQFQQRLARMSPALRMRTLNHLAGEHAKTSSPITAKPLTQVTSPPSTQEVSVANPVRNAIGHNHQVNATTSRMQLMMVWNLELSTTSSIA